MSTRTPRHCSPTEFGQRNSRGTVRYGRGWPIRFAPVVADFVGGEFPLKQTSDSLASRHVSVKNECPHRNGACHDRRYPHRRGFRRVHEGSVDFGFTNHTVARRPRHPQHPHVPEHYPPRRLNCAASRTTSGRRENASSSSQWQRARHCCAIRAIASPSTSPQSMRPGSTRSKSGFSILVRKPLRVGNFASKNHLPAAD